MKITVAEAAQLVNRALPTFKVAIREGEIPVYSKPGPLPTYVVELDEVVACFKERRRRYVDRPTNIPRGPDKQKRKRRSR